MGAKFLFAGIKAQIDEDDGRILLGDNKAKWWTC
jgi:hypothetical protein